MNHDTNSLVAVKRSLPDQFADHVVERTHQNWKYWVFTSIMGHFVHSFAQEVSNASQHDFETTSIEWITNSMSLQQLRKGNYQYEDCNRISYTDKFLHKYFTDLSESIGFEENNSLSLFDVPSIFIRELQQDSLCATEGTPTKELFLYSQCKMKTLITKFHSCYSDHWTYFINQDDDGEY